MQKSKRVPIGVAVKSAEGGTRSKLFRPQRGAHARDNLGGPTFLRARRTRDTCIAKLANMRPWKREGLNKGADTQTRRSGTATETDARSGLINLGGGTVILRKFAAETARRLQGRDESSEAAALKEH